MLAKDLDLQQLYRLPWSKFDNPNGWIEPTTYCQLACPGCYRGLDLPNPIRQNVDLVRAKKEINQLKKIRKIKILAIAGGEPLLYPHINELISYAKHKKLKVRLVTNGIALTEPRLRILKKHGLTEVAIHIASYQKRGNAKTEEDTNLMRENYCQMFRNVGGVELGFIMTVSKSNFKKLPIIINFYKNNSDIISRVIFTVYKDAHLTNNNQENNTNYVSFTKIFNLVSKMYKSNPCAYLPKKISKKEPSWIFFAPILQKNKTIAYVDDKTVAKLHSINPSAYWNSFPAKQNAKDLIKSLSYISPSTLKRIFFGFLKNTITSPNKIFFIPKCQIVIIINTPSLTNSGLDTCDGCPDAILYKNKLVPSCMLERIKLGDNFTL